MINPPQAGASLGAWLAYLECLDPNRIELGLARMRRVLAALALDRPGYRVFTIGGTNGKGSVAAYLSALLRETGHGPVGLYTSPHLVDYRERITVDGRWVGEAELVAAFEKIETVRGEVPLTYFEFGTAAALEVFRGAGVRDAVLEVGLGGRLDAVNALDPAASAVVSVDLDHQKWLGNDRDSIGREKAGIFRGGVPAIIGDRRPPSGLVETARTLGADVRLIGRDFDAEPAGENRWRYRGLARTLEGLPDPGIPGSYQRDNASVALALLESTDPAALDSGDAIGTALRSVRLAGRLERRFSPGDVEWVLDVAHNPAAAGPLADWLHKAPRRRTQAVLGMLADKDARAVVDAIAGFIDTWHLAGLDGSRGQSSEELASRIGGLITEPLLWDNIAEAVAAAARRAHSGERIVVFGSFHTLAQALASGIVPAEGSCASV